MSEVSTTVGWIGVVVAIVFFGSGMVPLKLKQVQDAQVDPMVFQLYYSIAIFVLNWAVLTYNEFHFTYWGIIGATIWVPASVCSIFGVKFLGLSVANGLWSGLTIIISFIWGAGYFRDEVGNPYLTALGLVLLIVGIMALAAVKTEVKQGPPKTEDEKHLLNSTSSTESIDEIQPHVTTEKSVGREAQFNEFWDPLAARYEQKPEEQTDIPESVIIPETKPGNRVVALLRKSLSLILGLLCVLGCGILNGSMMVPNRFNVDPKTKGVVYLASFGIGVGIVTPIVFVLYFLAKRQLPKFHFKIALLPGLCTGTFWTMGNLGSTYAVLSPLGLTVGFPLTQSCLIISGLWAIFMFKEITGWKSILHFFAAVLLLLGPGCALLAVFGTK